MVLLLQAFTVIGVIYIAIMHYSLSKTIFKMATQVEVIKQLVLDSVDTLTDLVASEAAQDTQLDTLIQTAEDIKNNEANGADQTETVTNLTNFVAALKTARDASKTQTAKVQVALTALQTPDAGTGTAPTLTDKTYNASTGETIVVSEAGDTPAAGESVTVNGAALTAAATYTLSDGATLSIGDDSKVVSYSAAPAQPQA